MFTGIITEVGRLRAIRRGGSQAQLEVECRETAARSQVGGSIAVCGVCLTATAVGDRSFTADLSSETLKVTSLGSKQVGASVNLELPVTPQSFLSGHLVSGHVEGRGKLLSIRRQGDDATLRFAAPTDILETSIPRGSITVEGVSLTITRLDGRSFEVVVIPHTLEKTNLGDISVGEEVNLEADMIGRYVWAALRRPVRSKE